MLLFNLLANLAQVVHQLFLLVLFTKEIGHLLLEGADEVGMDHRKPWPLGQVTEFPDSSLWRQILDVFEEVLFLGLEEFVVVWDEKWLGPEGAKEHPDHLGGFDDLPQRPHETPMNPTAHGILIWSAWFSTTQVLSS